MGLDDREYYREPTGGLLSNRTMVTNLILLNLGVFVVEVLAPSHLSMLYLDSETLMRPWDYWQLLTYGFVHDPNDIAHVGFNMFGLWLFGREVEGIYGRWEFLRVYLTLVVMAGLFWLLVENFRHPGAPGADLLGASGAVMGIMMIFVLHFPRRMFYFWFLLPVPAWVLAVLYLLADTMGVIDRTDNVAHVAHLSGAAFGFIYYRSGWNLGRLVPSGNWLRWLKVRPRLRLHDPEAAERDFNRQIDRILEKIGQEGEASLTRQERRTLQEASKRYQRKRQ